jgi:hypothetical protein
MGIAAGLVPLKVEERSAQITFTGLELPWILRGRDLVLAAGEMIELQTCQSKAVLL